MGLAVGPSNSFGTRSSPAANNTAACVPCTRIKAGSQPTRGIMADKGSDLLNMSLGEPAMHTGIVHVACRVQKFRYGRGCALVPASHLPNAADDIIKAKLEKKPTGRGRGRGSRQGGEERTDKRLRVTVQDGGMKRKQPRRVSDLWLQNSQ